MRRHFLLLVFLSTAACSSSDSDQPAGKPATDASDATTSFTDTPHSPDAEDVPAPPGQWTQPAGTAAITFFADDRQNQTYASGDIQWTGSFAWSKADNTIAPATSWLPSDREWPRLYDDGPIGAGGHEAEGQTAGDHIHSTEVWLAAAQDTTIEYGALNEFLRWIWIGPNGAVVVTAGDTGRHDAAGLTFPKFGDIDLRLAIDLTKLHPDYATVNANDYNVYVKGTMDSWTPIQILDSGKKGDEAAGDGVFTYLHSASLDTHDGLVALGDHVQFVFVFAIKGVEPDSGLEYKVDGNAVADGTRAWSGKDGAFHEETIILEPDSYGKVKNTTVIVSDGGTPPPPECSDQQPCGDALTCKDGKCVPIGSPSKPSVSVIDPDHGPMAGGTAVTITGDDFLEGAQVFFGDAEATGVVVVDPGTIACASPAGAPGAVNVTVVNADGGSGTYPNGFTYTAAGAPVLSKVEPAEGDLMGGTPVHLIGEGFALGAEVRFGVKLGTAVIYDGPTSITCYSPQADGPGAVDVTITNPDQQLSTLAGAFTYLPGLPDYAVLETPYDVSGFVAKPAPTVRARVYEPNLTEADGAGPGLTAELGWGVKGGDPQTGFDWKAATYAGQGGDGGHDDVYEAALPSDVAPATYDWAFRFSLDGKKWIYADRDGTANGYESAQAGTFAVTTPPVGLGVFSFSPAYGPAFGETEVTIKGQDFGTEPEVRFGDQLASKVVVKSPTELVATTPLLGPMAAEVKVSTGGKSAVADTPFNFAYIATPAIDGAIGADWPEHCKVAEDGLTNPWDGNHLDLLYVAFDDAGLTLGITGALEAGNAVIAYVDTDYGTGIGASPEGLTDALGPLDDAMSAPALAVTDAKFGAEFAVGSVGTASVTVAGGLSESAGARVFSNSADFDWVPADVVWGTGAVEMRIPWSSVGVAPKAGGRTLGIAVRMVNADGTYANTAEGFPTPDNANGAIDGAVIVWVP